MTVNIEQLIALADKLDAAGKHKEAAEVDAEIKKLSAKKIDFRQKQEKPVEKSEDAPKAQQKKRESKEEKEKREDLENAQRELEETRRQSILPPREFGDDIPTLSKEDVEKIIKELSENPAKLRILQEMQKPEGYDEFELNNRIDEIDWTNTKSPSKMVLKIVENMRKAGWQVFTPGELEVWLQHKDYTKGPSDLPGVELSEEDLQGENIPKGMPGLLVPEQSAEDDDYPGMLDLSDPNRLGGGLEKMKADIKSALDSFLENPTAEAAESIGGKVAEYAEKRSLTDEETASELERLEKEKGIVWSEKKKVLEKLSETADRLDKLGAVEEANLIDGFIKKHADDIIDYEGEDKTSEQSKRYDSEYHHSLQVREPKKKKERVDREGRDSHHVHTYQTTEASSLNTRYCPDHIGVMVGRVGENTYQCPKDGQVYNFETGWTDYEGNEHPGGSVAAQTPDSSGYAIPHRIFDSRENILNRIN